MWQILDVLQAVLTIALIVKEEKKMQDAMPVGPFAGVSWTKAGWARFWENWSKRWDAGILYLRQHWADMLAMAVLTAITMTKLLVRQHLFILADDSFVAKISFCMNCCVIPLSLRIRNKERHELSSLATALLGIIALGEILYAVNTHHYILRDAAEVIANMARDTIFWIFGVLGIFGFFISLASPFGFLLWVLGAPIWAIVAMNFIK